MSTALTAGAAMLASEQLGVAERGLEMTVGYVNERHPLDTPDRHRVMLATLADLPPAPGGPGD